MLKNVQSNIYQACILWIIALWSTFWVNVMQKPHIWDQSTVLACDRAYIMPCFFIRGRNMPEECCQCHCSWCPGSLCCQVIRYHDCVCEITGPLFTKKTPPYGYRNPQYMPKTVWSDVRLRFIMGIPIPITRSLGESRLRSQGHISQQTHYAIMTSLLRQNDVILT